MANMSYCRFQNTVTDLQDCYDHIDDESLSKEESRAQTHLITLCREIAALFDDEADDSFEELEERIDTLTAALADSYERNRQMAAEVARLNGENAHQAQTILYLTAQCQECIDQLVGQEPKLQQSFQFNEAYYQKALAVLEGKLYSEGCNQ